MRGTDIHSRTVIDQAIGIMIALRGCSADAAFAELATGVKETGIGLAVLAAGLVAVAGGTTFVEHV